MSSLLMPRQQPLTLLFHLMVACALLGPTLGIPLPGFKMTLFRVTFILLVAGMVIQWVKRNTSVFGHLMPVRWVAAFAAFWFFYAVLSLTWVANLPYGIRYVTFLGTMLLLTLSFPMFLRGTEMLKQSARVLLGVFFILVAFGIVESLTSFHLPSSRYYGTDALQVTSFFTNQNDFATAITLGLPFLATAMILLPLTLRGKAFVYVTGILALACLFITGSRSNSAFVLPLVTLLWMGLIPVVLPRRQWMNRRQLLRGGFLLLVAALAVWLLVSTLLSEHSRMKLGTSIGIIQDIQGNWFHPDEGEAILVDHSAPGDQSVAIRKHLISNGLAFLAQSHYLGVGAGNVEHYMAGAPGVSDKTNIHNWWMEVLVNFGVGVFICYIGWVGWMLWRLWHLSDQRKHPQLSPWIRWGAVSSLIALTGYVIGGMAPSTAIHFTPMWVVHGLALTVIALGEREIKRERGFAQGEGTR